MSSRNCPDNSFLSRVAPVALWFVLVISLLGCEQNTSNFRTVDLNEGGKGPSILTDTKQRIITNIDIVNRSVPGQVLPKRIVCAEPSPDVASAFSEAVQAHLKSDDKETGFGFSAAESVCQLGERLGTIQLLRDMAYRNCEAYANGAINATSYTILNSRLNKTVVTLLATEAIAGAFGRNLANIGANSSTNKKPGDGEEAPESETSASADTRLSGEIEGRSNMTKEVAIALENMHRSFIDDHSFVTLIDACVAHLNTYQLNPTAGDVRAEQDENRDNVDESTKDYDAQRRFFEAVVRAEEKLRNSIFAQSCGEAILPMAVEIAKVESIAEKRNQTLEKISDIIAACKETSSKDTAGCKNLGTILDRLVYTDEP